MLTKLKGSGQHPQQSYVAYIAGSAQVEKLCFEAPLQVCVPLHVRAG